MGAYLSELVKVTQGATTAAGATGTSTITGGIVDMSGFDGVLAIVSIGPVATGGASTLKWQQDSAAAMGSAADLLGTSVAIAEDGDNKTYMSDLLHPRERYVRLVVTRSGGAGGTEATIGSVTYIQYGAHNRPTTQGTNVLTTEQHYSPAEGTA